MVFFPAARAPMMDAYGIRKHANDDKNFFLLRKFFLYIFAFLPFFARRNGGFPAFSILAGCHPLADQILATRFLLASVSRTLPTETLGI